VIEESNVNVRVISGRKRSVAEGEPGRY